MINSKRLLQRLIISVFMLTLPLIYVCGQSKHEYVMKVEMKDYSVMRFVLSEKPVVSFSIDSVVVSTPENTYIGYSQVNRIYFDDDYVPTKVDQLEANKLTIRISSDEVVISNAGDAKVSAYSVDGRSLPVDQIYNGDDIVVSLSPYKRGIVIFKVKNKSFKIIKK